MDELVSQTQSMDISHTFSNDISSMSTSIDNGSDSDYDAGNGEFDYHPSAELICSLQQKAPECIQQQINHYENNGYA